MRAIMYKLEKNSASRC